MIEIIALIFLSRRIGYMAIRKGLNPLPWKIYMIAAWIGAELTGCIIAMIMFGESNLVAVFSIGLLSAFGGYLLVRYILEKKPDNIEEDINKIGVDDLHPPKSI